MTPQAASVAIKFCDAVFTECPKSAPASWKVRQMADSFKAGTSDDVFERMFGTKPTQTDSDKKP